MAATRLRCDPSTPLSPSPNASLLEGDLICSSHYAARSYGYLKIGSGVYWRHDPRLSLLQNTIDQPDNEPHTTYLTYRPANRLTDQPNA